MTAWYNEHDPKAAAWLRELIKNNLIAPGIVDERSIEDIAPNELRGFTQVHFFAGIGVWSYGLRRAGWPDTRPVWTGSCPCQPFSAAGKGGGFADERHLWPAFHWLIEQCQPECIFGEQVASKDAEPWLDLVQADLEGLGYAFGACAFPSAGIGAPHIRDRSYWVAHSDSAVAQQPARQRAEPLYAHGAGAFGQPDGRSDAGRMADADRGQRDGQSELRGAEHDGQDARRAQGGGEPGARRVDSGLADASSIGRRESGDRDNAGHDRAQLDADVSNDGLGRHALPHGTGAQGEHGLREMATHAGPVNGGWADADWIYCRNGEWRPVEPGTFPLAHGAPARVGRLRGYGNALNAEAAQTFIESYLESEEDHARTAA